MLPVESGHFYISGIYLLEETKEAFRSHSLWKSSKGLNMFYDKGPLYCASVYRSIMKLPLVRTRFFYLWNYGNSVAWTSDNLTTFWQSLPIPATEVLLYIIELQDNLFLKQWIMQHLSKYHFIRLLSNFNQSEVINNCVLSNFNQSEVINSYVLSNFNQSEVINSCV